MNATVQKAEDHHLITEVELNRLVQAVEQFHARGVDAFAEICNSLGKDVAAALLLAHMSEKFGGLRQAVAMLRRTRVFNQ